MIRSELFQLLLGCAAAAAMIFLAASAQAQASPRFFIDDFDDMNIQDGIPVSWVPAFDDVIDASSGDLVFTSVGVGGVATVDGFTYDNVSIRTQLRVLGEPFLDAGVVARERPNNGYIASISSADWLEAPSSLLIAGFFGGNYEILRREPTSLDPTQTDVMLQFDLMGENLTLTAWADGTPQQSISVQDNRHQEGAIGIEQDDGIPSYFPPQDPTPAVFRFFEAGPGPCDFNNDLDCDIDDLNTLLQEGPVAPGVGVTPGVNGQFDLNGDGIIDNADVDEWLARAATVNGFGAPYKRGDSNLDGSVDVTAMAWWTWQISIIGASTSSLPRTT